MTYTPINWQTGDTITAEKMNKMDNGWGVTSTQLFSETVTTAEQSGMYSATLAYSDTINANKLTVTFDGTEYDCSRIDAFGNYYYGGFSSSGPDFTNYPFAIESINGANKIYTETASTHTVAAAVPTLQTSSDFIEAVSAAIGGAFYTVAPGVTTWQEVADAMGAGKVVFCYQFEEANEYSQFSLITEADTDGNGTYRVRMMTASATDVYARTLTATSADSPLRSS